MDYNVTFRSAWMLGPLTYPCPKIKIDLWDKVL